MKPASVCILCMPAAIALPLADCFANARSQPASQPASTRPALSIEQIEDMIFDLDSLHDLQLDPDNSEGGWTRLISLAARLQEVDPSLLEKSLFRFVNEYGHRDQTEGFKGTSYDDEWSKAMLLIRVMFDIPQDALVPEEYEPKPWGYGGFIMACPASPGADSVDEALMMPMAWTQDGPTLPCYLQGYKGVIPYRADKEYRYFREHFKPRPGLSRYLSSRWKERPPVDGVRVPVYRHVNAKATPETEPYEFSENDGEGYEKVAVNYFYRNFAPIHEAAKRSDIEVIRKQLARKVPVDLRVRNDAGYGWWFDTTPLMWAILEGDARTVRFLIQSGADVNARSDGGLTPLMFAAGAEEMSGPDGAEKIRLLLAAGAALETEDEEGHTPLIWAGSRDGDPARLQALLDAGARVNARNSEGSTPLIEAAESADLARIKALVGAGADVKAKTDTGWNALMVAAVYNPDPAVVEFLIDAGSDVGALDTNCSNQTVLMWAARSDMDPERRVKALLAAGADVNATTEGGWTALMDAADAGDLPTIETLLKARAKASARTTGGTTALHMAADSHRHDPRCLKALLAAGADANAATEEGLTALMDVAKAGDVAGVRILLDAGAHGWTKDEEGRTALIEAAASELAHRPVVEMLISAGAEVNAADVKGMTPLMHAAATGRVPSTVQTLLEAGADPSAKDKQGRTALDLAREGKSSRARRILDMLTRSPN